MHATKPYYLSIITITQHSLPFVPSAPPKNSLIISAKFIQLPCQLPPHTITIIIITSRQFMQVVLLQHNNHCVGNDTSTHSHSLAPRCFFFFFSLLILIMGIGYLPNYLIRYGKLCNSLLFDSEPWYS